jgi:hypothetical protein
VLSYRGDELDRSHPQADAKYRWPLAAACQWSHIPRITMHRDNSTNRRAAMIAKDLILTKDNSRISA